MVGVNHFENETEGDPIPLPKIDERVQRQQLDNLAKVKAERDCSAVHEALSDVRAAARGSDNLMPPIIRAASAYCTQQEICDVLRDVMGTHSYRAEF
jgi:methylmalonyl-CoA mutase N-terminal domain/subunit